MGLYEDPDQELKPSVILRKSGYSVGLIQLRKTTIELINDGLIEEGELSGTEHYIRLTTKAVAILNEHTTYDRYLETQETRQRQSERKENRSSNRTIFFEVTTAIFTLIAVVLGILSYLDKQELNEKANQVKELKIIVLRQQIKLDSLQQLKQEEVKSNK